VVLNLKEVGMVLKTKAPDKHCFFLYLNAPYLWEKTPFGIDCSGFTQMVYKLNGYFIEMHHNRLHREKL
jgi:hypothetical protein